MYSRIATVLLLALILTTAATAEESDLTPDERKRKLLQKEAASLENRLNTTVIKNCSFEEAPLDVVLGFLREQTAELNEDGKGFNVLYACSPEARKQKITMSLQHVPVIKLLRFCCVAARVPVNFRLEKHAVVITDRRPNQAVNNY